MEKSQDLSDWNEFKYEGLGLTIYAKLNTDQDKIKDNIEKNIAKGRPQVWPHKETEIKCLIVAGGPSLKDYLEVVREKQKEGAKVVALANTAKYLLKHGIRPDCHVLLDARPNNSKFIDDSLDCTYLVASQCDPSVLDKLDGKEKVFIWHAVNSDKEFELINSAYPQWIPIQGGSTIALRAFRLLHVLGYHNFEVFGMDSCYLDGKHHSYEQPAADDSDIKEIGLNGHKFKCNGWMIQQAMDFLKMVKMFGQNWNMIVHGPGLISTMIKEA